MLRMTKDGETTVPSSEEYAKQLEAQGWTYVADPVEPKPLPEDFPMRAELTTLGVTNTTQLDKFMDDFDGKMSQIKRARGKLD